MSVSTKRRAWIEAFRLRTLPLAISCILLGSALAAQQHAASTAVTFAAIITALMLQILSNLANDYGDHINGADTSARTGPLRVTSSGLVTLTEIRRMIVLFILLSLASGVTLLSLSYNNIGWQGAAGLFGTGLLSIVAAITYTASKNPYGYKGYGDISVFIFFGIVAVAGTFYLHTGHIPWITFLPASGMGLLSISVLNVNNIRDIQTDKDAGKITIPVRLGLQRAKLYHTLLLATAAGCFISYGMRTFAHWYQFLFLMPLLLLFINGRGIHRGRLASDFMPYLKQLVLTILIITISYAAALLL